jgi:RNA polymerase sigma-70 factor (ECF subfamily)
MAAILPAVRDASAPPPGTREFSRFATTRWSVVCAAADAASARQPAALEELCRAYWLPLYAFLRQSGHLPEDAQDLTQAFFSRLLERGLLARADPGRGRFRSFLLTALKRFAADAHDHDTARKRGGGQVRLSVDADTAEFGYRALPSRELGPDAVYERSWALAVLDRALITLRAEHAARGRAGVFDALKDHVWGDPGGGTIAEAGAAAGLGEAAARVAVHRLRARFGEILREQIADTLADPADVDAELRHLLAILGG